jgi:di/tricarboxylate transporter
MGFTLFLKSFLLTIPSLDGVSWITLLIFAAIFIGLIFEFRSPDVTMLVGTSFFVVTGVLTPQQYLQGFTNEILVTIAMLCILVRSVEVNGLLDVIGQKILSLSKTIWVQMFWITAPVSFFSAFLNNTPIVLLMTPLVRRWALKLKLPPSRYLIPLSYASLIGGMCTIIGTSTNLVVYSLLKKISPHLDLSFFELGFVGIPIGIVALLYLIFIAWRLLPVRQEPTESFSEDIKQLTAEFQIQVDCPFIKRKVSELSSRYFLLAQLVQIQRGETVVTSPEENEVLCLNDRLVFVGDVNEIANLHTISGLVPLHDPKFKLDISSSHFSEVVITPGSSLVGKTLKQVNFRHVWGASVLAIYRQGVRQGGDISKQPLYAGDTLLLLSGEPWRDQHRETKDFYYIRQHEKLFVLHPIKAILVATSFALMILAMIFHVPIVYASLLAALFVLLSGCISLKEAKNSIAWDLLLLIATSFSLGKALEITGLATSFANSFLQSTDPNPHFFIGAILAVAIITTELMSNIAAALIIFPIASQAGVLLGFDSPSALSAIAVAVAIGCSCGFAIPTGYQTHMIVYGPGGYRFSDFARTGIIMDLIYLTLGTLLIPKIWPLL